MDTLDEQSAHSLRKSWKRVIGGRRAGVDRESGRVEKIIPKKIGTFLDSGAMSEGKVKESVLESTMVS